MTWENFYLTCFFVGLILSALSFFSGAFHLHLPTKFHLPHALQHGGVGRLGTLKPGSCAQSGTASDIPFFNMSSTMAFLCWFGGMGYLLTHYSSLWVVLAFFLSALTGLGGAAIVFWFLVKVILAHEHPIEAEDFEMVGIVGSVSSPIRAGGGTGEIVFLQQGTRRVACARSSDGSAIPKGAEIVVTRYEKGIAYVRPWNEFAEENRLDPGDVSEKEAQQKVQ